MSNLPRIYVCDGCGGEVQRRYSAWWYERDGVLALAEHDDDAECVESWCPSCGEQVSASPSDAVDPLVVRQRVWQDDGIQFARSAIKMRALSASMDLPVKRIEELFARAEVAFEAMKPKKEEEK